MTTHRSIPQHPSRRSFLRAALDGAGMIMSSSVLSGPLNPAFAQLGAALLADIALRDDLIQIAGAGSNIVLLRGPDGFAMVDSGSPQSAAALTRHLADRFNSAPLDLLFNTHWHLEHTGANEALRQDETRIVAHENTRLWMSTEYYVDWQDHTYEPRSAAALPTDTFYSSDPQPLRIDLGHETIEYGHLPNAHTDGDIYVFFRERNVIVAGGAVSAGAYPVLDFATGGWIGGLRDSTAKLLEIADSDTLIVPDVGPAQPRTHLEAQLEMVSAVHERVSELMRQGKSAEEMIAAGVVNDFDNAWGSNRERFIINVYGGLWWQGRLNGSL